MYRLGRFLQLLGLLIAPVGLAGNLAKRELVSTGIELGILAAGLGVFALGWLIQRRRPPAVSGSSYNNRHVLHPRRIPGLSSPGGAGSPGRRRARAT